jgi:hypothetical protein
MRIRNRILNISEEIVLKELSAIAADKQFRMFSKPRLSDVIEKDTYLDTHHFSYYTRSHFDFVITGHELKPFMAIEYDGPYHDSTEQVARDAIKHFLCKEASLPILRINANHVLRKYRGMTLLRWIIEVIQAQKWFYEAQAKGDVPFDEPFDAAMIIADGSGRQWPYWLSASALGRINKFVRTMEGAGAWITLLGEDETRTLHSLEYIRVDDHILYVRTSVRSQDADIPQYDIIREVTHCEMGEQLTRFLQGEHQLISIKEFQSIHDQVCKQYKMSTCSSMGTGLDLPPGAGAW